MQGVSSLAIALMTLSPSAWAVDVAALEKTDESVRGWIFLLGDSDRRCSSKKSPAPPAALEVYVVKISETCNESESGTTANRERTTTVSLRGLTWRGFPLAKIIKSGGVDEGLGFGTETHYLLEVPFDEVKPAIVDWWKSRKLEIEDFGAAGLLARTGEGGTERISAYATDPSMSSFTNSFAD